MSAAAREAFVREMEEVLVAHGELILSAFDHYASLGTSDDLFHIQALGWKTMLEENGLIVPGSKACDLQHLDLIFVAVNQASAAHASARLPTAKAPAKKGAPRQWAHHTKNDLDRAEFVHCLCRIAVARFMLAGKARLTDVSDALAALLATFRARAHPATLQDSNAFRNANCCARCRRRHYSRD